jgi:rfaE bifunctional protein nucleotidyltransferase chain/domain
MRSQHFKIATLNGSFDLLHAGHLYIIHQASLQADQLIVLVNSDESIQAYKSPNRPIVPLCYRLELIAALEFVDAVSFFEESDPCSALARIAPDVHVNGIEYGENCIEAKVVKEHGGRLHLVDRIPGLATSEVLKKVKSL